MRIILRAVLIAIVSVSFLTTASWGAGIKKIGIIDFQKILETSDAGKGAQEKVSVEGKKMEAELKEKGKEINALEKKLEREGMVMSKEAREEKQREIRIKINDAKNLQAKYRRDFKKIEAKVIQKIEKDVFVLIQKIAKDEKFEMVLEKRAGGVVYFEESWEITDLVIGKFNAEFTAKPKTPSE